MSKLPQLPSLDGLDENKGKENSGGQGLPELPDMPGLPSLDELEIQSSDDLSEMPDIDELPEMPALDELGDDYETETSDSEEEYEEEIDEEYEDEEYEEDFDEEDFGEYEEDYEGDGELLSFLPPADVDEVPVPEEVEEELQEIEEDEEVEETEPQKKRDERDSNELDEEKVKEFFNNIKNKITGGKSKGKSTKINKGKKRIPSQVLGLIITIAIILVMIGGFLAFRDSQYKPLNEITHELKSDRNHVELYDFKQKGDILIAKAKNLGDMSAELFIDLTIEEQGPNPIKSGKEITCSSEIVGISVDDVSDISFKCSENIEGNVRVDARAEDLN